MSRRKIAYLAALSASLAMMTSGLADAGPRGVIELFTSQGCSSCPPADKLLGALSDDSSLVTISMPVDYWDYLGWKDTLGDPRNSARQRAYARSRGDRQVYTPQVVVNGAAHTIGSDKAEIEQAITQTRRNAAVLSVPVNVSVQGSELLVDVGGKEDGAAAEVWLYGIAKAVPVAVQRGENRGSTITYHNVARRWIKLGDWNGKPAHWKVPLKEFSAEGVDGAAVLVQGGTADNPGKMLGAAVASLR
ncbi:MAG: DUF1223 domain-containing protein [Xanthobacteraceae bacterium]